MSVPIKEIMSNDIITLPADQTVQYAAQEMIANAIGSIVILDTEDNKPIGIITPYDIMESIIAGKDIAKIPLSSFNRPLIQVNEDDPVSAAAVKFINFQIHHLIVTNNENELTGILSTLDLAKAIKR